MVCVWLRVSNSFMAAAESFKKRTHASSLGAQSDGAEQLAGQADRAKQQKRETQWLQAPPKRAPRIGGDFQVDVDALPEPNADYQSGGLPEQPPAQKEQQEE